MANDITGHDAALKQYYLDNPPEDLVLKESAALALLTKHEKFPGRNIPIVTVWKHAGARSATFADAQTGADNAPGMDDFLLTRVKDHARVFIDSETLYATESDMGAFLDAQTLSIDGILSQLGRSLGRDLYRSGYGELGVISAIDGDTITIADSDVLNFEVGYVVQFAQTLATTALRDSAQALTVEAVDYNENTVTFTENTSEISGLAVGDYVFTKGDRQNSASPSRLKIAGFGAWCPASAPSASESFFNVDRSVSSRLVGVRHAPSAGTPLDQILVDAAMKVAKMGGKLTHYFMSNTRLGELINILGTKVQYIDVKATPTIGFQGVRVMGTKGPIDVIADDCCPDDVVFGVDLKSWTLYSAGKAVRLWDDDGKILDRRADADGVDVRARFMGNLACRAPCHNVRVTLSS